MMESSLDMSEDVDDPVINPKLEEELLPEENVIEGEEIEGDAGVAGETNSFSSSKTVVGRNSRRSTRLKEKKSFSVYYREDGENRKRKNDTELNGERRWSDVDKRQFLVGLRRYGSKEVGKVASEVKNKTRDLVQKKIQREKKNQNNTIETRWISDDGLMTVLDSGEKYGKGKIKLESLDLPDITPQGKIVEVEKKRPRHMPIEQWVEVVESQNGPVDCSVVVPSILSWIADLEPHPDPNECNGVDYASIYRYIAQLCQRVSDLMLMLECVPNEMDLKKGSQYLENYRGPFSKYRYRDTFDFTSGEVRSMEELGKVPGMNSLGFHPEMMVSLKIPQLETLMDSFRPELVAVSDEENASAEDDLEDNNESDD